MLRKPDYIAFLAVVGVVLMLLNLPERAATRLKLTLGSAFVPLFGLIGSGQALAEQGESALLSRRTLVSELDRLRSENSRLRLQAQQGAEALRENERLRALIGWQRQLPWKSRAARVIARDPENWWRTLLIDLGSRDGLKPDCAVVCQDGLVGRTGEVGLASSQVVLVGDPKCRAAVMVRETGDNGVISATASSVLDHRLADMTHLPRQSSLRPGQTVVTSGLGGVFPAGIPVGTVVDSRTVSYGLMTEARVKLGADSSRLNEVVVLLP